MNREDAAREIDNTACCFSDKRFRDSMHMAAAALRGPQPDPITGLVPCGCGGKPTFLYSYVARDDECYLECPRCGARSSLRLGEERARDSWNTAMGWRKQNDKR